MGKKVSWFSAIKRVFTHNSKEKEKPTNGSDNKSSEEKKKGKGILRQGESKSLIPLFREPSSIEKLLGEADQLLIRPPPPPPTTTSSSQRPKTPPRLASPKAAASPTPHLKDLTASSKAAAPKVSESGKEIRNVQRSEPTFRNQHLSATKIQTVFRGYLARRSFRALRGLVRLQQVVRGQNVKRQTMNAMKQMQMLVRVQMQIQSRRIQMLENQALQRQSYKEVESTLSKWTSQLSEAGQNEDWDDSLLTKAEEEARLQKKVEAVIKRERAMAYAYSHQLWKANPKSAQSPLDKRSNGFPWWWNWLEHQLPEAGTSQSQYVTKSIALTPPRPNSEFNPSPRLHNKQSNFTFGNHESLTPRSSTSVRAQQLQTPPPNTSSIHNIKYSKPREIASNSSAFDDDSLMSFPPFSVPNYMTPTVSAKAKARANSNPKDRFPRTPGNDSNRRFSFPLTPSIASSFKGRSNKDSASQIHDSSRSIGEFSAVSMPSLVGRKPFNRFV